MYRISIIIILLASAGCSSGEHDGRQAWGIDISKHQRSVDWERVLSRNPPDFVFLKATEGLIITDPSYEKHARELDSLGIVRGAYHFFGHRTPGHDQARAFIRAARLGRGNLLPVLDIEPHRFMTDPKKMVREARAFCRTVRRYYGTNPIIYCSTIFYETYLKKDFPPGKYRLWIADYRSDPDHIEWLFWQHTDSHRMEGIGGKVDRNVMRGGRRALKKLTL